MSSPIPDATSTFTYDTVGRLVKASDTAPGAGTIDFAYDVLDRLIQETTGQGTVSYQYDVLGRRTQMTANGQQPTSYQYDAASRLTRVEQGALFAALGYDNANRRTRLGYSNGTNTAYAYDLASRLTGITHNGPSGVIEALTYAYDAAGNRVSLTRGNGTASLLPNAVASATYDAANEQTVFGGATLTYDLNGNLTNDGVNTYQWDARNRLIGVSGGATAAFNYDALGRRTTKVVGSVTSQFLYDRHDVAAEIGGAAVGATYLRSLNIDEPFIRQTSTGNEFYHTDALGSSLALSNGQGSSVTTYSYDPFGKTQASSSTSVNLFQYTGRENDVGGFYYYRKRYYHSIFQRFIGQDPIGFEGGINLYAYVGNNPLRFRDAFGLQSFEACSFSGGCSPMQNPSPDTDLEHLKESVREQTPQEDPSRGLDRLRDRLKEPSKNAAEDKLIDKTLEKIDRGCGRMLGRCGVPPVPPDVLDELRKIIVPDADAAIIPGSTPPQQPKMGGRK